MKPKKTFQATTLRGLLSVLLIVVLGLCCGGFYLTFGWVKSYGSEVNAVVVTSKQAAQTTPTSSSAQKAQLAANQGVIDTINSLLAPSATFQQQAIADITAYANTSGLSVSDFKTDTAAAGTPATATPVAAVATVAPSQSLTVTLNAPVSYTGLVKFLSGIEQNIPKMQVAGIDIAGDPANAANVIVTTLTIQVFTK